jgi:hypothetical protein
MEYLVSSNQNILDQGKEPAFVISNRREVIDPTLMTNWIVNPVRNWQVSDKPSLSDHRYLLFPIRNVENTKVTFRDRKKTDGTSRTYQ